MQFLAGAADTETRSSSPRIAVLYSTSLSLFEKPVTRIELVTSPLPGEDKGIEILTETGF